MSSYSTFEVSLKFGLKGSSKALALKALVSEPVFRQGTKASVSGPVY